jgi:hypothetical protein
LGNDRKDEEMNKDCTVLVCSCDKYADLLTPFSILWKKYWADCPFEMVLVTESSLEENLCFDRVVSCGKGLSWCERLIKALDSIETPYVIMLCDDYFLNSKVDTEQMQYRLEQARKYDAANLRLIPNPIPNARNSVPVEDGLCEYRKDTAYCIATQAGIWNREFLRNLAFGKASIWEFERYGSFDLSNEKRALLVTQKKEFPFIDAVHKGCWEKFGIKCLTDNKIEYDFSKRGFPSFKTRFVEGLKALVFAVVPNTWIVKVQNAFSLGAKERL